MKNKKALGWGELILGTLLILLGIYSFLHPTTALTGAAVVYGIFALVSGVLDIVYYAKLERRTGFGPVFSLVGGILSVAAGPPGPRAPRRGTPRPPPGPPAGGRGRRPAASQRGKRRVDAGAFLPPLVYRPLCGQVGPPAFSADVCRHRLLLLYAGGQLHRLAFRRPDDCKSSGFPDLLRLCDWRLFAPLRAGQPGVRLYTLRSPSLR